MGYESTIEEVSVRIKFDSIPIVQVQLDKYKHNGKGFDRQLFMGYFFDVMTVDDDGNIEFDEYCGKWYESDDFAHWLAQYCTKGELVFVGEDNTRWGYYFDGKRSLYQLEFPTKRGKKL